MTISKESNDDATDNFFELNGMWPTDQNYFFRRFAWHLNMWIHASITLQCYNYHSGHSNSMVFDLNGDIRPHFGWQYYTFCNLANRTRHDPLPGCRLRNQFAGKAWSQTRLRFTHGITRGLSKNDSLSSKYQTGKSHICVYITAHVPHQVIMLDVQLFCVHTIKLKVQIAAGHGCQLDNTTGNLTLHIICIVTAPTLT